MVDWGTLAQWAAVFVAVGLALWAKLDRKGEVAKQEQSAALVGLNRTLTEGLAQLRSEIGRSFQRIDDAEQRLTSAESELKHLPSKDALHKIELQMTRIEGGVLSLDHRITPIARAVDRIESAQLNKAE